jgi:nitroreductase
MSTLPTSPFHELARARRTTRAFRDHPVAPQVLADLLQTASLAPSTFNTQPWRVHVLTGSALAGLSAAILEVHAMDTLPVFSPFPQPCPEASALLQADFGRRYYEALDIDRTDMAARGRQTARNYGFFGAPAGMMLTIDRRLKAHSWLDLGLFLQTLMLAACERGLASCPQVAFLRYEHVIARQLGFEPQEALACGLSLGHADESAPVNRFPMPRAALDGFVRWHR